MTKGGRIYEIGMDKVELLKFLDSCGFGDRPWKKGQ